MPTEEDDSLLVPSADGTPPLLTLMRLMYQQWRSPALYAAVELKIPDALGNRALTTAELAERTGAHAPSLYRLLRALAHIGVFTQLSEDRFANNAESHLLRSDVTGSVADAAVTNCGLMHGALTELAHTVRTGEPGFGRAHGMPMWPYLTEYDPAAGTRFNAAMAQASAAVVPSLVRAAALAGSAVRSVVDIGAGRGGLLRALLDSSPRTGRGVLFDRPSVIEEVRSDPDVTADGRVELVAGDFFSAVPVGADLYVMKWILHDWDDEACVRLLHVCRQAMHAGSRLLVADVVIDPRHSDELAYGMDLEMLVSLGGKERTAAEFAALYDEAGLRLTRVVPTASMYSLVEGVPQSNGQDSG
ncbi:methyltransferase [Streptomyces sp. DSM 118878]